MSSRDERPGHSIDHKHVAYDFLTMPRTTREGILRDLGVWEDRERDGREFEADAMEALREIRRRSCVPAFAALVKQARG